MKGKISFCFFLPFLPFLLPHSVQMRRRSQVGSKNMKNLISSLVIMISACAFALTGYFVFSSERGARAQDDARLKREQLYRLNNIGVAFMEQFSTKTP